MAGTASHHHNTGHIDGHATRRATGPRPKHRYPEHRNTSTRTQRSYRARLDELDTSPRPVRQGAWLAATIAIVALFLATRELPASTATPSDATFDSGLTNSGLTTESGMAVGTTRLSATAASPSTVPTAADLGRDDDWAHRVSAADADLVDRADDALALVAYRWQQMLPEWRIEFLHQRDGLYGLTLVPEKRIEIYVRPDQGSVFLAHVIAHELGHAVDVELNDEQERARWAEVRDIGDAPWWPTSGATDFSTGAGDFAESFAAWQVGDGAFRSAIGGPPNADELDLLAALSAG